MINIFKRSFWSCLFDGLYDFVKDGRYFSFIIHCLSFTISFPSLLILSFFDILGVNFYE